MHIKYILIGGCNADNCLEFHALTNAFSVILAYISGFNLFIAATHFYVDYIIIII